MYKLAMRYYLFGFCKPTYGSVAVCAKSSQSFYEFLRGNERDN